MRQMLVNLLYGIFRLLPIRKKSVLLFSYYGADYGCSPKYISECLDDYVDIKQCWAFVDKKKFTGIRPSSVRYGGFRFYYLLATAAAIVTNYRMVSSFRKRKGQLYIQTWHSSLRLKMIEGDAICSLGDDYIRMAKRDSSQIDLLLSGCRFSSEIFKRSFWYSGKILECGTPRMDVFFDRNKTDEIRRNTLAELGIESGIKVILYAPTFRQGHKTDVYDIDFDALVSSLERKFGGRWTVLVRLHPHLKNVSRKWCENNHDKVTDVTSYPDMQQLLISSDAVITDYSSLMFDYAYTHRPLWLYASDFDEYSRNERGLYFNIEDLPFPLCKNNADLSRAINNFNGEVYNVSLDSFMSKIGSKENGTASRQVADIIHKHSIL